MNIPFDLTITTSALIAMMGAVIGWFRIRNTTVDRRLGDLDERLDRHETRILTTEQAVAALPGHADLNDLKLAISGIHGELKEMRAEQRGNGKIMSRLETIVTRHEDHLLGARK